MEGLGDPVAQDMRGSGGSQAEAVVQGRHELGTVVPRHALDALDDAMLAHILDRNAPVGAALVDAKGLGGHRARVLGMLESSGLKVVRA